MAESLKSKTKEGLIWRAVDQFANYGMQFIVGIFMARQLSPSDYGITALPAVFMSVAGIFIGGGFGTALIRKEDVTEEDLSTAFYYSIAVGLFFYVGLFLASPYIAAFYNVPVLTKMIRITALSFLWSPLTTPQSVILTRKLDFKNPARISILNKIVGSIVGITMAYTGFGLWSLVFSGLSSSLMSLAQLWLLVKWYPRAKFSKESFKYLFNYGNKLMGVSLLNELNANIVPVLLGKFGGAAQLGNYNRAKGYAMLPSSNIAGVITGVSFPLLSKIQADNDRLSVVYRKMIRVSCFIVFPLMTMLAALAKPLIIVMITEKWIDCVILLQLLCLPFMFQPMHILNVTLLQVKGRPDLLLRLEIIKKAICSSIFIYVAAKCSLVTLCLTDFGCSMFALILNTYYTGKIINVGYFKQLGDAFPAAALSASMFALVVWVNSFLSNMWLQIIVGGAAGGSFYLIASLLFRMPEIGWLKELALSRKR